MKKIIISAALIIQFITLSILFVSVFDTSNVIQVLFNNNTEVRLFSVDREQDSISAKQYSIFIDFLTEKDIHISRYTQRDLFNLTVYTTYPDLAKRLPDGMPTDRPNDNNIVGAVSFLLFDFYQRANITVTDLHYYRYIPDGRHYIHTTCPQRIEKIVYFSNENQIGIDIDIISDSSLLNIFIMVLFVFFRDFAVFHLPIFLGIVFAIMAASSTDLRENIILLANGYGHVRVLGITFLKYCKIYILAIGAGALTVSFYGITVFGYGISLTSIFICLILLLLLLLICIYHMIYFATSIILIKHFSFNTILKGATHIFFAPSYILRSLFLILTMISVINLADTPEITKPYLPANAQYLYWLNPGFFLFGDLYKEAQMHDDLVVLHDYLSANFNGFIINTSSYQGLGLGISKDNIDFVKVSPNYFYYNPISCVKGDSVTNSLIFDDYVLNIIVPNNLRCYHDYILNLYLELFYFNKIGVENIYREMQNQPLSNTTIDQLSINIIYSKYNQQYFTINTTGVYRLNIQPVNPIIVVYTGSESPAFLFSSMTSSYFIDLGGNRNIADVNNKIQYLNIARGKTTIIPVQELNNRIYTQAKSEYVKNIAFTLTHIILVIWSTWMMFSVLILKQEQKIKSLKISGYGFLRQYSSVAILIIIFNLISFALSFMVIGHKTFFFLFPLALFDLLVFKYLIALTERR